MYARTLEADLARVHAENSRLRDENRALLNSIPGIAGIPPVYSISAEDPRSLLSFGAGPEAPAFGAGLTNNKKHSSTGTSQTEPRTDPTKKDVRLAAPLRRRSWHQINRALEFQSARKGPPDSGQET